MKKEIKNELPDGVHRFLTPTKTGFKDKPLYCLSLQTHRRNLSITEDPKGDFVNLFPFNEDSLHSIVESIQNKGFDKTQVIHLDNI